MQTGTAPGGRVAVARTATHAIARHCRLLLEKEVRPLLAERHMGCHGNAKPKGGLKLTARAASRRAVIAVRSCRIPKPDENLVVKPGATMMSHVCRRRARLTSRHIATLERWVAGRRGLAGWGAG